MFGPIQTRSADFADALVSARYAAEGDLGLFILGETGTGKEHLARAVHDASPRAKGPFVAINCASIPEPQIESELVGHKKRSFSGAEGNRDGAFMTANGGTLLLDEIGDAPSRVQYALLRVLESRTVKPVGSDHERPFDVRAIAATSRDVMRLMREGKLREDVYFRLAEQSVVIPPLRERVCDIRSMAESMLKALGCDKPLSAEAISLLERYRWPGNVREFRHALNRAMVIAKKSSAELNARCFPHLDQVVTSFGEEAPPFDFPDLVVGVAMLVWKDKSLDETRVRSKYERRAVQRAALLYLARVYQVQAFPAALMLHWTRLFGERWATTENGRGAKELLRVLGRLPTDRAALEWILWKVGRG
jgi:transcriptional regulator with PAS, ATPase and Fis domain